MKRWIKLYTIEWIEGTIRCDLAPAERGIWADLLVMAGISRREGYIERSQGVPYRVEELANRFVVPIELLQSTLDKCQLEGRITINSDNTIQITNWDKYQAVPEGKQKHMENAPERELRERRNLRIYAERYPDEAQRILKEEQEHRELQSQAKARAKGGA